jgi:hypothetical protein
MEQVSIEMREWYWFDLYTTTLYSHTLYSHTLYE